VNASGDSLSEQSRPLLQVEDVRLATGGENALLESRDWGYFIVDLPNFWERSEMSGLLRDVNKKPDKNAHLANGRRRLNQKVC
jgi:type IV secretion system protein VirD4